MRRTRRSLFLTRHLLPIAISLIVVIFAAILIIHNSSAASVNKSFISSFGVKSMSDGTKPFNADNNAGNDKDDKNKIVRSFDYINYSLSYVTELMPGERTVDEGNLMVEFELATDPSVAEINADTIKWINDLKVTYYYSDGSHSETWDQTKTVTKQIASGYRKLTVNENGSNAIPGAGSLSVGVFVKAAKNNQNIQPKFTVWMEGNAANLKKQVTSENVRVSAAPRYDIYTVSNGNADMMVYYNQSAGTLSSSAASGTTMGRLTGYAFGLSLYNQSADFGLKGIELPQGDITFDVRMKSLLNDEDVSSNASYQALLWDYRENNGANANVKGRLNRQMVVDGHYLQAYRAWSIPGNDNNGNRKQSCYKGGTYTVAQDASNANLYHVTVKGYDFDRVNFIFPNDGLQDTPSVQFGANIGFFSVGYLEYIARFPSNVDTASTFLLSATAENMHATSASGTAVTTEQLTDNNSVSSNITLYPKGSISVRNYYVNKDNETNRASVWYNGDNSGYAGERLRVMLQGRYNGDGALSAISLLHKFDDEVLSVAEDITNPVTFYATSSLSRVDSSKIQFAAKSDKSGWASDAEMNAAKEENLVYFDSIQALKNGGYTCVGYRVRVTGQFYYDGDGQILKEFATVDTSNDVSKIGKVYQITGTMRAWKNSTDFNTTPNLAYEPNSYGKVVYENGTIVGGHTGGVQYGNSLLLIGAKNTITIAVNDKTTTPGGSTVAKAVYDLDKGERTAEFIVQPKLEISSNNNAEEHSNQKTDVTVKVDFPKDLHYVMGTASTDPVSVVNNDDGTQTITWLIRDQRVGEAMDAITLKATIGKAGTADDVSNNDSITATTTISSPVDSRSITETNGNISHTTISVIKLATSSISKTVGKELVESGEDITYSLKYGNGDDDVVNNMRMVDILPYNGDDRDNNFNGSYRVKTVSLNFTSAPDTYNLVKNNAAVYYTTDTDVRSGNTRNILTSQSGRNWTRLTGATINDSTKTITFSNINLSNVVAMYFAVGDVQSKEYINTDITLTPKDASGNLISVNGKTQQPGDFYVNNFMEFADNQIGVVISNSVTSQVIIRILSGKAWYDANNNGVRESSESILPNVAVKLVNPDGSMATDVLGRAIAETTTNSSGDYEFDMLAQKTYRVQIAGGDYGLAPKDAGSDDKVDSDASPYVTNGQLSYGYFDRAMPAASTLYSYRYESKNNDAGFTRATLQVRKENKDGSLVDGAVFSFANKTYNATNGTFTIPGLGVGVGTLTETEAPQGYKIAGPWTVRTVVADDGTISASIDGASKNGSAYVLTNYLKDSKIKNKITKSSATTEITKKDQAIDYKIHYDVELTDYMGDAKVSVVDKLPHAIIEDQSELDGGVYDADKLTITWEEDWTSINTYVGANKKSFEYNISLVYDGILGTDRELNNEATGHVTLIDVETEPTNETEPGDEEDDEPTPIRIPGRIITKFIEIGTDKEVCKSDNAVGLIGDPYHTRAKECEGYELVKSPDKEDYNFEENDQIVTYYYRKLENPNTEGKAV